MPNPVNVPTYLTDEEHQLLNFLSVISGQFKDLIKPGSSETAACDWAEVASKIHDLQARVMSVAGHRAYRSRYRSLVTRED